MHQMQAYSEGFARFYNARCFPFAQRMAGMICDFYESTDVGRQEKCILDLGCGTGQLAVRFLERGYRVIGIDLSKNMLTHAEANAQQYVQSGQATFINGSMSDFVLKERCGLVVSTFDSLNHLEDEQSLQRCFQCVRTVNCGYFVFDMNTRRGITRCSNIMLDDSDEDLLVISRGCSDGRGSRGWLQITGFVRRDNGLFERFDQVASETGFEMRRVREMLLDTGWTQTIFCSVGDLQKPLSIGDAEKEQRIVVVANV